MSTIVFAFAIFCGWLIFDVVKNKKVTLEMVLSSAIVAVVAGIFWWLLEWIF